jgi:hypothetical protein
MAADNPWVTPPPVEVRPATRVPVVDVPPATGPTGPQRGVPAPDEAEQLPIVDRPAGPGLWWLGAHGGSGESTLAALVEGWEAAGHAWPRQPDGPARVVLVARSNMRGLRAAQVAATQWAAGLAGDVDVLGLVIVADAPGRRPRPLRDFARVVAGGVPRTWELPWHEPWRLGEDLVLGTAPRRVRALVEDLQTLILPSGSTVDLGGRTARTGGATTATKRASERNSG